MILTKGLRCPFSKMILFNGVLSFSPNTINNTFMSYALAKRWEELNVPYDKWLQLISKVREVNNDIHAYGKLANPAKDYNLKLFSDWNVEGDGAVYSQYKAKAIFDPAQSDPFVILNESEQFSVSSPMGAHKAVIADLDTDSQSKSKIFSYQLVIDNQLSLAIEPSEFRNLTQKYSRNLFADFPNAANDGYLPSMLGVDWFMMGSMAVLTHKDNFNARLKVLSDFPAELKTSKAGSQATLQKYILRMNQFNYNYQTKLSFISGYIEPTTSLEAMPTVNWRTAQLMFQSSPPSNQQDMQIPKTVYMRQVKNGDAVLGVLFDLNNLLEVKTVGSQFVLKEAVEFSFSSQQDQNPAKYRFAREQLEKQCGLCFIPGRSLTPQSPYNNITVQYLDDTVPAGSTRIVQGAESEFSFEIVDRFKKTKHVGDGDGSLNVENFSEYIEYNFRCMRMGSNIDPSVRAALGNKIRLSIDYTVTKDGPMDLRGILQYSNNISTQILEEALNNTEHPSFRNKYGSLENIKTNYYQDMYDEITNIATTLEQKIKTVNPITGAQSYFWKNSKGQHFAPLFFDPTTGQIIGNSAEIAIDENGRGSFYLSLNERLTKENNPRTLATPEQREKGANSILSSIAVECIINAAFERPGVEKVKLSDTVSGTYFESDLSLEQQNPDWKNYVGPRLRVMGLLYPAMQKIVDLYSFANVNLDAMKRAFDVESELHSRYMPSTREISPFEHRMIRRWLYEPFFDNHTHTNIDFSRVNVKPRTLDDKKSFTEKKAELREKLKVAFAFELFTIPLYLTAMYTTSSIEYQQTFRGVIHDEMKHLFIASNLINAIREPGCTDYSNGPPYLDPRYVPKFQEGTVTFPMYVYDTTNSPQEVKDLYSFNIFPLSDEVLLKMIAAEFPSESRNLVLSTEGVPADKAAKIQSVFDRVINPVNQQQERNPKFHTIGELYAEIVAMLWDLHDREAESKENVLFSGNAAMQFTYPQLTNMVEIYSLRTALNQIRLIVDEGEGARIFDVRNQLKKLSHFLKFIEVYTGCLVDQEKTDRLNGPHISKDQHFTIYFKDRDVTHTEAKNNWAVNPEQDPTLRGYVAEEAPGRVPYGFANYTNTADVVGFTNVYRKIMQELHYVFNSNYSNFKQYIIRKKGLADDPQALENEFKAFKFKRMENAIAKMRQMSMHARYNIRQTPIPDYEVPAPVNSLESKRNQGLSVRPDYNIVVEFPNDDQ